MISSLVFQPLADLGPLLPYLFNCLEELKVLLYCPAFLGDFWIQMVHPHFPTLTVAPEEPSLRAGVKFKGDAFPLNFITNIF
jgi:hypothetical protein